MFDHLADLLAGEVGADAVPQTDDFALEQPAVAGKQDPVLQVRLFGDRLIFPFRVIEGVEAEQAEVIVQLAQVVIEDKSDFLGRQVIGPGIIGLDIDHVPVADVITQVHGLTAHADGPHFRVRDAEGFEDVFERDLSRETVFDRPVFPLRRQEIIQLSMDIQKDLSHRSGDVIGSSRFLSMYNTTAGRSGHTRLTSMQIYYIRHAQSANNQLYAESGSDHGRVEDPRLTELGWQQARLLARHISEGSSGAIQNSTGLAFKIAGEGDLYSYHFTHIYSSLMTRALQTASALARDLDLPVFGMEELFETGGIYLEDPESGEFTGKPGKTPAELRREFPELILPEGLSEDGWYNRPFEPREERLPRARRVLETLTARHGGTSDRIALISHGGFFQYFMTAILGLDQRPPVWFLLNNAGIARIDVGEHFDLIYLNRTHFLPDPMIT